MIPRIMISGFFLRRSAWHRAFMGHCFDELRDESVDLASWIQQMSLHLALFERVELIGHSFGGYLAQCLAAMCPEKVSQLWLLSALTSEGGSALESYQQSGQNDMMSICKLDVAQGRIALHSAEHFHHLLGGNIPLADSEPAQLLLDLPPSSIADLSCPVNYLITEQDRLTSVSHQLTFAGRLNARVFYWPGGHIAPLSDTRWLSKNIY